MVLNLVAKFNRISYAGEGLFCAAGARDDDRAIAQASTQKRLFYSDRLNFGEQHFEGIATEQAGFDNDPFVGQGKFMC